MVTRAWEIRRERGPGREAGGGQVMSRAGHSVCSVWTAVRVHELLSHEISKPQQLGPVKGISHSLTLGLVNSCYSRADFAQHGSVERCRPGASCDDEYALSPCCGD